MRVIKIDRLRVSKKILEEVVMALRSGAVIAFPTETSYGLAADPKNKKAVRKIFAIKGRERNKPLPLVAGSFDDAWIFVELDDHAKQLARQYWPGPLTIIAPLRSPNDIAWKTGEKKPTAAIRVPRLRWARDIAAAFGRPITSTSANLAGQPNIYSGAALRRIFASGDYKPAIILDAGTLPHRQPSTIVRVKNGKIEVMRQGGIKI